MSMRVLLVANTLPPRDLSGVGEQVLQLAVGLRERGHEVEVLGRGEGGAPGPKLFFPVTIAVPFLRRLRELRPHVVQVHESDGALAALLVRVLAALHRPRPVLVALLQVSYLEEIKAVRPLFDGERRIAKPGAAELAFRLLKAPLQVALGCLSAWLADLVLAPSQETAAEIRRDYAVESIGVVPNVTGGLEWDAAAPPTGSRRRGLVYVGRLRIRKGVEILLSAIHRLRSEFPDLELAVVGDGEQRGALEAFVDDLELGSHVSMLGRRSPAEVRSLLASSEALVVPSIYEGMPLVILEAMEQALPVVASSVSGIPEVVVDGETGWLVPREDSKRLAAALREVLTDPNEARRRGEAGRGRVRSQFRPAHAAELWEGQVRPLVSDGSGDSETK